MQTSNSSLYLPALDQAIDRNFTVVEPDTVLTDVLALIGQVQGNYCLFGKASGNQINRSSLEEETSWSVSFQQALDKQPLSNSSCIVVVSEAQVTGILTSVDVVRLTATGLIPSQEVTISEVMTQPVITLTPSDGQEIFTALLLFRQHQICHLPIVDNHGQPLGVVTPKSILQALQPANLLKLRTVEEVMNTHMVTVPPTASVLHVAQLMMEQQVNHVVIAECREAGKIPLGIVTQQKIVQAQVLGLDVLQTPASDVMRRLGYELDPDDSLLRAHQQMQSQDMQMLLVSRRRTDIHASLLGAIADADLLRALEPAKMYQGLKRAQQSVRQLELEKTELLRSRNAELERQVQQRTTQLQEALSQVEQQAKQAALINQIVQAIRGTLVLDEVLQTTADQLHEAFNVSRCLIFQPDTQEQTSVGHFSQATSEQEQRIEIYCSLIDYYQDLLGQGNQVSLGRIDQTLAPEVQSVANQFGIHAILMTPLVYQQEWLGSICLYQCDREREWTVSELEFVKAIADHCAIAIHRAKLYQQLQTELAERKQAETALQKLNEELEVKVEERTFVLKQLNQQLLCEIAERNQAQKALQKSEEQFRSLSACSPVGIFLSDVNGRCTYINPRTQAIAGFSFTFEESLQKGWTEFVHQEDRERVFAEWSTYAQSGHEYSNEFRFQTPKRSVSWVHVRSSPMFSSKGELIGHVGTIEDITERKQAEDVLRRQLAAVEAATDGIAILNHEGEFIYLNHSYVKIFGYNSARELIGKTWRELYSQKEIKHFERNVFPSLLQNKKWQGEATAKKQDGTTFAQEVSLTSIEGEGLICVCRDITERKWAEEQLKASLKEKEVLLKEIHHRVKNNLQIISSLLKLQSGYIKDEEAFNLFTDIYNRIRSMAILHEQLYQSEDLSRIKAKEYICKLVENLSRSYGMASTHVSIQVEVDDIELDIDTSISCGLIVNELITNSFKYAFVGMQYGEIFIKLLQNKDMDMTLIVRDTGIGLSPNFNIYEVDSLGLQLVSNLIEKLDGTLDMDCSIGTSFKIIFNRINKWSR